MQGGTGTSGCAEGWEEQSGLGVQGVEEEQACLDVGRGTAVARCQASGDKLGGTCFEEWFVGGQPGAPQKSWVPPAPAVSKDPKPAAVFPTSSPGAGSGPSPTPVPALMAVIWEKGKLETFLPLPEGPGWWRCDAGATPTRAVGDYCPQSLASFPKS